MTKNKIPLASDNYSSVHPLIMEAIIQANESDALPYGNDPYTKQAKHLIQKAFKSQPEVLMTPSGTGANVLALKLGCQRHESVICTEIAHIKEQESGAPESIAGCKLLGVPHKNGKLSVDAVLRQINYEKASEKHATSPRILSLTQPTELGTIYTLKELKALSTLCKEEGLLLHIDGSRIYNALAKLSCSFDEMFQDVSIDLFSLGGTKNGLMFAEALLIFNPNLQKGSDHIHKQTLQLVSKMRYLSAQYIPFFEKNLNQTLAHHANQKALELEKLIEKTPQLSLSYPVETNQIFFTLSADLIPWIQKHIECYLWNNEKNEIRFVTSWNTSNKEIEKLSLLFKQLPVLS